MAKISIFKVLEARKRIRLITVLASAIVIVLLLQGFVLNNPKSSKAGVSEAAGVVTIDGSDGSIYTVDPDGYLYRFSNALLEDYDSYYNSYDTPLDVGFQAATGYSVLTSYQLKDKEVVIRNGARVLMEGKQSFKKLTIQSGAQVQQPYADRTGLINKPLYHSDRWAVRFTGFLKVDNNLKYWLHADTGTSDGTTANDDAVMVEIGNTSNVDSTTWNVVYRNNYSSGSDTWGARKNTSLATFQADTTSVNLLTNNSGQVKYVPIRLSFADYNGATRFYVHLHKYNLNWSANSNGPLQRTLLYGAASDGTLSVDNDATLDNGSPNPDYNKPDLQRVMEFRYYLMKNRRSGFMSSAFSAAEVAYTAQMEHMNLSEAFRNGWGDYLFDDTSTGNNDNFDYRFQTSNQAASPIGSTNANHDGLRSVIHSNQPINTNAFDDPKTPLGNSRRINAGLTLEVAEDLNIQTTNGINLTGNGYPGWANEFQGASQYYSSIHGAGPGGGCSDSWGGNGAQGGGASHAGQGGTNSRCWGQGGGWRAPTYGSLYSSSLGSGGGASTDDSWANLGGNGGGSLAISANTVNLLSATSIRVDGGIGRHFGWHSNTGGAGGHVTLKTDKLVITAGITEAISVRGGGWPALRYPYISGNTTQMNMSAGGGGYALVQYNLAKTSANSAMSTGQIETIINVDGGNGGRVGDVGIKKAERINNFYSVEKRLLAKTRGGVNCNQSTGANCFNPYAIQLDDIITVNLKLTDLNPAVSTVVTDEILTVPYSSVRCDPSGQYISSGGSYTAGSPGSVKWSLTGLTEQELSYDCQIKN